jgi:PAS domain S-box-containing protein
VAETSRVPARCRLHKSPSGGNSKQRTVGLSVPSQRFADSTAQVSEIVVKDKLGGGRVPTDDPGTIGAKGEPGAAVDLAAELKREIQLHQETRKELERVRDQARRKSDECDEIHERFKRAFQGAKIHAFAQDRDLRYTWVAGPYGDEASQMLGRTDDELYTSAEKRTVVALKRRVLETGTPEDCEVSYILPDRRALFALHIDPLLATDGTVDGVMCTAVDISHVRSLESDQRRLIEDLAIAAQRYEFALRGSNVAVFTQDTDLRYSSVSKPIFDCDIESIHGRTDDELLAAEHAAAIVALKSDVLASGEPRDAELRIETATSARWYDFHIEPMRDVSGRLVGVTGSAVDVTERKESEAHLRLLMRELTHRSKNLLAVIQAMARQTAKHTGSIQAFLERFSARVQALARSHDILVQESWHGASLKELVRSQLAFYLDREPDQVSIEGPDVRLKPEAAQSLGLALHELAANAAKHGALSLSGGRVEINWQPWVDGAGIELVWRESRGPKVTAPSRRGFGTMVIEHNLARALDAEVNLNFATEGLTCTVAVPKNQLVAAAS